MQGEKWISAFCSFLASADQQPTTIANEWPLLDKNIKIHSQALLNMEQNHHRFQSQYNWVLPWHGSQSFERAEVRDQAWRRSTGCRYLLTALLQCHYLSDWAGLRCLRHHHNHHHHLNAQHTFAQCLRTKTMGLALPKKEHETSVNCWHEVQHLICGATRRDTRWKLAKLVE